MLHTDAIEKFLEMVNGVGVFAPFYQAAHADADTHPTSTDPITHAEITALFEREFGFTQHNLTLHDTTLQLKTYERQFRDTLFEFDRLNLTQNAITLRKERFVMQILSHIKEPASPAPPPPAAFFISHPSNPPVSTTNWFPTCSPSWTDNASSKNPKST
ncbi:MAG: hypothetical protein NC048_02175 [Bacteroides sp.]|nr:hypothetical protein [Bacteroides sp.]